jgi:membrane-bound inhibitor of C-type lysozyme
MPLRLAACVLAVLLAACGAVPPRAAAPATRYACSDGRSVVARYPDTDTAMLDIDGVAHVLTIARSADGARYVGDGWQWWAKGLRHGSLAPLVAGETVATAAGVACEAAAP